MKQQIFVKATREGKAFFQAPDVDSDFGQFECLMLKFGEFPYLITLNRKMESLQRIRAKRLHNLILEVEDAAKRYFGPTYRIRDFVLVGEFVKSQFAECENLLG